MDFVFFDIGDTLASPVLKMEANKLKLTELIVYPYITPLLQELKQDNRKLGIISNTGDETAASMKIALTNAGLIEFFEESLLIYSSVEGMSKGTPEIFRRAAQRAGTNPQNCIFVGEDVVERQVALQAGLEVCPHPLLVKAVLSGNQLRFVRAQLWDDIEADGWTSAKTLDLPFVPLYRTGKDGKTIYAIADTGAIVGSTQFDVEVLNVGDPLTRQLYLVRDDLSEKSETFESSGQFQSLFVNSSEASMISSINEESLIVSLSANADIEEFHPADALHGHTIKLVPDMGLLSRFGQGAGKRSISFLSAGFVPSALSEGELDAIKLIDGAVVGSHLRRYIGDEAVDGNGTRILSRSTKHQNNLDAVKALYSDLKSLEGGVLDVRLHSYTDRGEQLFNVEAELKGVSSDDVVIIGAHLDSTAKATPGYNSKRSNAPGADDDGSGIAAVLAIAKVFCHLNKSIQPDRSIRFVLFNSEEDGLVGSKMYAKTQSGSNVPIVAVYQMDMIGYNVNPPASWEIHCGFWSESDIQERSVVLARMIEDIVGQVSPDLPSPQIYISTGVADSERDPAENRSDHASFHQEGYAACITSGDFFPGPNSVAEPNPNYHRDTDTFANVNLEYAAAIARAIAAAAWLTAKL